MTRPRPQPPAAHRGAARPRPQQGAARHAPVTKGTRTRPGSALRIAWPAHALLHFDHPDVLHLTTEPGASIAVTLQVIIRTRGVAGRELTLPYHTTIYARADRDGQVRLPLRDAYVPTHPTPATLTVVARTASGTVRQSTPLTLLR